MKRIGLGGAALLPAGGFLSAKNVARDSGLRGGLTAGDAAIRDFRRQWEFWKVTCGSNIEVGTLHTGAPAIPILELPSRKSST